MQGNSYAHSYRVQWHRRKTCSCAAQAGVKYRVPVFLEFKPVETNQLNNLLAELAHRTEALRGYL